MRLDGLAFFVLHEVRTRTLEDTSHATADARSVTTRLDTIATSFEANQSN